MKRFIHLAGRVFDTPLAIHPKKLEIIMAVLRPRLGLSAQDIFDDAQEDDDPLDMTSEASQRKPYQVTPDGTAIVPVCGTLVHKASGLDALSGMTSYTRLSGMFAQAMADTDVKAVLLDIDSPGGEVSGMFDLADQIFNARGQKPIYAMADDMACSAAYIIASSADRIFASRTSVVGSIGIIAMHRDQSAADAQNGLKYTALYAGDHKNDGNPHEPLSDSAASDLQATVNKFYGMFVDTVARNRGMAAKAVRDTEAKIYIGEDAVTAGLADEITTFDAAISSISSAQVARKTSNMAASADMNSTEEVVPSMDPNMNAAEQKTAPGAAAQPPAVDNTQAVAAAQEAGFAAAAEVVDLCAIAGKPELAAEFLTKKTPVADVRKALISAKATAQAEQVSTAKLPGDSAEKPAASPLAKAVDALISKGAK